MHFTEQETITVRIPEQKYPKFKEIFSALREKYPNLNLSSPKRGEIRDDLLVSFKVNSQFMEFIIEKLLRNDIGVLALNEKTKQIIDRLNRQSSGMPLTSRQGWSEIKSAKESQKSKTEEYIDHYIETGNYPELLKIARGVNFSKKDTDKAQRNIFNCVANYAAQNYHFGVINSSNREKYINKLISAASDKYLKSLLSIDFLNNIGLDAIKLAALSDEYISILIRMANNSSLHCLINIKAAIKFYQIIIADQEKFAEEIQIAVRDLNTRYLLISFKTINTKLDSSEKNDFNQLIEFIKSKRNT